jgi:hypothetical protein
VFSQESKFNIHTFQRSYKNNNTAQLSIYTDIVLLELHDIYKKNIALPLLHISNLKLKDLWSNFHSCTATAEGKMNIGCAPPSYRND